MEKHQVVERTQLKRIKRIIRIDEEDQLAQNWVKENLLNIE